MRPHHRLLLLLSVLALPANAAERDDLQALLIGLYASTGTPQVYHKIVEVSAPMLGRRVLYHQIARDDVDSVKPLVQKFYVLGDDPREDGIVVTQPYSVKPGTWPANLESDAAALERVEPAALQRFPPECALIWRHDTAANTWVGTPVSKRCRFRSETLGQLIVPELRYEASAAGFAMHEVLRDTRGNPIFPDSGRLVTMRQPVDTASAIIALSRQSEWRPLPADRLLRLELASGARLWLELRADLAPLAVQNIRTLVREKYFDDLAITRVQDNFVAQWSDPLGSRSLGSASPTVPAEFSLPWPDGAAIEWLPDTDGYAPRSGYLDGMPIGGDPAAKRIWGAHCYGTLGVGRDNEDNSGNGAELYVVIGHAPRQLDRNITVVGRVVRGIEHLSALPRGPAPAGMYASASQHHGIRHIRVESELPAAEQQPLEALRTDSASFRALIEARRNRRDRWYKRPAGHVEVCNVPLPVRDRVRSAE